jgi:methylglutaconyl-CoA hydratase
MPLSKEIVGNVLVVTLDRPEARNAFDSATIETLTELFESVSYREPPPPEGVNDEALGHREYRPHAVLLRSTGSVFCAGGDLSDMRRLGAADFQENLAAAIAMGAMFRAIRLCPVPVVARVQGPAFGGGVGLACCCDIVVAGSEARFTFSEVRLGLVAGVIAPLVIERIGQAAARHYFLTGDPTLGFERSLEFTAQMIAEARTSPEAQAALAAFFAKEPAPWSTDISWPPSGG